MPTEHQTSFAAGALSSNLWGRSDLPQYANGLRSLLNFFVSQHGVVMNRSGTQHVNLIPGDGTARLYGFVTSEVSWILAFTEGRTLVYRADADDPRFGFDNVSSAFDTPFDDDDLENLKFAQDGDQLLVFCRGVPVQLFERDGNDLLFSELSFDAPLYPEGISVPALHTVEAGGGWFAGVGVIAARQDMGLDPSQPEDAEAQLRGDETHPKREWTWAVTRIVEAPDGTSYETMAVNVTNYYVSVMADATDTADEGAADDTIRTMPRSVAVYPDWPQRIILDIEDFNDSLVLALSGFGELPEGHVIKKARIYRGRDGNFGYVGETTGSFFVDDIATPDYSDPPPGGRNPFELVDGDPEYPTVGCHFAGRRLLAASTERPNFIAASAIDKLGNFDKVRLPDAEDALEFFLRSQVTQEIRWLVPRKRFLVALTNTGEWTIAGSGENQIIAPGSVFAQEVGRNGSSPICPPLVVDDTVLFVDGAGVTPMAMLVNGDEAQQADLSILASDYFETSTIVDWAYAKRPFRLIWAVRDDGVLLSCTYLPKQGVLAWAEHEIAGDGFVESVCVVPEGAEDAVYLVVKRQDANGNDKRWLERLAYRAYTGDIRDCIHLDRCVTHNAVPEADASTAFVFNPVAEEGPPDDVDGTFRAYYTGTSPWGTGGDYIGEPVIFYDPDSGAAARCLVAFYGISAGKKFYNIRFLGIDPDAAVATYPWLFASAEINPLVALPDATVTHGGWAKPMRSVGGLAHLEGQTVTAVVDGNAVYDLVVTAGSVSLAEDQQYEDYGGVVHVGLSFDSDLETLDIAQDKTKQKAVARAWISVARARGGKVGTALDDKMVELRNRETGDEYATMTVKREDVPTNTASDWNTHGRVAFRQSEPYPCTVAGIIREYVLGGD
jgi:hypothetical protein